jgi:hypothetical protein
MIIQKRAMHYFDFVWITLLYITCDDILQNIYKPRNEYFMGPNED